MSNERLSISMAAELVGWVKDEAARLDTTQSAVVARALRRMRRAEMTRDIIIATREDAGLDVSPETIDALMRTLPVGDR